MSRLGVWWDGRLVAEVDEVRGRMRCTYASSAAPMLSVSMPPRAAPWPDRQARPFFQGLLPEAETRRMIAYDLGLGNDGGRDLDLLAAVGRDCAGALVVSPEPPTPPAPAPAVALSAKDVARRLRDLPQHPLGVDGQVRVSLPGVQPKLLLVRSGRRWEAPSPGRPSTHILKPQTDRFEASVENEVLCQVLAGRCGVEAAATKRMVFDGLPALVSTRFDRRVERDGTIGRLHQEDGCQALSIRTDDPRNKYQLGTGGPTLRAIALVLDRWAARSELSALLRQVAFSVAIGNADLHARNLTFLHHGGGVRLAPAYDLMSTTWYRGRVGTDLALWINGRRDIDAVTLADVAEEARTWGLRPREIAPVLNDLFDRLPTAIEEAADAVPDAPEGLLGELRARVNRLR